MKITKPKKNQLLIEDDILKAYDLKVESKTGLVDSEYDKEYEGVIFAFRLPGMEASKQLFYGNSISINTLICSMLQNLVKKGVIDLDVVCKSVKECMRQENESIRRNKKN